MTQLTFNKTNNQWVAEFEATADFNLHIERNDVGTLGIYQRGTASGNWLNFSKYKMFDFHISENGTKKLHLIPCYRKSDGEIGLYDIINGKFYTNLGTGEFLKGADV